MSKILVVEDNSVLLDNIAFELEMRGYEVLQATDGKKALEVLNVMETPPDVIVSDIAMPDMDGYQFLEQVREVPQWTSVPFIFLTAFGSANAVRLGKELGVDDYLVKPFEPDDLVIAIENKLKRLKQFKQVAERQLDDARRELIQLVTHELRTPLTPLYMGIDLLTESLRELPDDSIQDILKTARSGADRLHRLINGVVLLTQLDSGHTARSYEKSAMRCDMNHVLETAVGNIERTNEAKNREVTVEVHYLDTTVFVSGLQAFLVFMCEELIRNGVKFSKAGQTVRVTLTTKDDVVNLSVADEGMGIAPADMPRIWERFIQINRDQYEQQGMGIGLTIVKAASAIHLGSIAIESAVGVGTTATLTLPIMVKAIGE